MKSRLVPFAILLLSAAISIAAITVVERSGPHELWHGTTILAEYANHQECISAIPAPPTAVAVSYSCKAVTIATVTGVCDPVEAPAFEMRLDNYMCPVTALHSYALIEVYEVEREPYPTCGWKEVGRRLLNCNDPVNPP